MGRFGVAWSKSPARTSLTFLHGTYSLDAELLAFHRWVKPTEEEHQFRRYVVDVFADVVRRLWPDATVQVFGSMATGLFLPTG